MAFRLIVPEAECLSDGQRFVSYALRSRAPSMP